MVRWYSHPFSKPHEGGKLLPFGEEQAAEEYEKMLQAHWNEVGCLRHGLQEGVDEIGDRKAEPGNFVEAVADCQGPSVGRTAVFETVVVELAENLVAAESTCPCVAEVVAEDAGGEARALVVAEVAAPGMERLEDFEKRLPAAVEAHLAALSARRACLVEVRLGFATAPPAE